ncbi:MAG: cytochrome b N-terminal domain-containing protein [Acidobacteriia bacterium]|nr:cytochrome b N-terminal domain-containing protein [Terriglobia bacterium]
MWKKLYLWLDERTGIETLIRKLNDEPIRGGARWAYVFGSTLLGLLAVQTFTGIFLTLYYAPTSDHAHSSVTYIQKAVAGGSILRGLHYYGASAILILVALHFIQTYLYGAYKGKRELQWNSGLVMFFLLLGFVFTGYLLPWTQEAYFGTKVGTSVLSEIPGIGPPLRRIILGGNETTTLTLSRFFTFHVWGLAVLFIFFIIFHLALFRRRGPAGPYHRHDDSRIESFYPRQAFRDAVVFLAVFVLLVILAYKIPAELGPQADPTSDYLARPPWYFLPLFELLKYFSGKLTLIPAVVLPGLILLVLVVLPFWDKKEERHPAYRPVAVLFLLLGIFGFSGLLGLSKYQDWSNRDFRAKIEKQRQDEKVFLAASFQPEEIGRTIAIPVPTLPAAPNVRDPILKIYFANCANCHGRDATGGQLGPSLIRLASTHHLSRDFLVRYIGGHSRDTSADMMPRFTQLSLEQRQDLAQWLMRLKSPEQLKEHEKTTSTSKPSAPPAKHRTVQKPEVEVTPAPTEPPPAFRQTCAFCHGNDAAGNIGPSLVGITDKPDRTPADLLKILEDSRSYGLKDPMPAGFPKLTDEEKKAIVDWLSKLK